MLVELLFAFDVGTTVITYGEMVASLDFKCHAGTPSYYTKQKVSKSVH